MKVDRKVPEETAEPEEMPEDENARKEVAENALHVLKESLAEVHHMLARLRNMVWEQRLRAHETFEANEAVREEFSSDGEGHDESGHRQKR